MQRRATWERALRGILSTFFDNSAAKAVAALLDVADSKLSEAELNEISELIQKAGRNGGTSHECNRTFVDRNRPGVFAASIRASILIFAASVITLLMHRSSSAARHLLWTFAMAGILLLPLLPGILPKWPVAVLPARAVNLNATTNGMSTENTSATSAMPHEIKMTVPIHSSHAPRIEHGENTSLIPEAPKYVAAPTPADRSFNIPFTIAFS